MSEYILESALLCLEAILELQVIFPKPRRIFAPMVEHGLSTARREGEWTEIYLRSVPYGRVVLGTFGVSMTLLGRND